MARRLRQYNTRSVQLGTQQLRASSPWAAYFLPNQGKGIVSDLVGGGFSPVTSPSRIVHGRYGVGIRSDGSSTYVEHKLPGGNSDLTIIGVASNAVLSLSPTNARMLGMNDDYNDPDGIQGRHWQLAINNASTIGVTKFIRFDGSGNPYALESLVLTADEARDGWMQIARSRGTQLDLWVRTKNRLGHVTLTASATPSADSGYIRLFNDFRSPPEADLDGALHLFAYAPEALTDSEIEALLESPFRDLETRRFWGVPKNIINNGKPKPKRIPHREFPPRNLARLSPLGRRALVIWSADYNGDVTGAYTHVLNGGAIRKEHSISCDGVDDYVFVASVTDSRLAGAASVTMYTDVVLGEFDTDPNYGWLDHIYDNGGAAASQIFNLMAEDNAVAIGFWGVRIITPKGDLQVGDRVRVAYSIRDGDTSTTTIYINGIKQPWTIEGGAHQIQNFLSTWKLALCGQYNSSTGTYENYGKHEAFACALFPEALSDEEMRVLTADPANALFELRRAWIPSIAGIPISSEAFWPLNYRATVQKDNAMHTQISAPADLQQRVLYQLLQQTDVVHDFAVQSSEKALQEQYFNTSWSLHLEQLQPLNILWEGTLDADQHMQWEALQEVMLHMKELLQLSSASDADRQIPVEWQGAASIELSSELMLSWKQLLHQKRPLNVAWSYTSEASMYLNFSAPDVAEQLHNVQIPIEWQGGALLNINTTIPLEWMQSINGVGNSIPVKINQVVLVDFSAGLENLLELMGDSILLVYNTETAVVDSSVPIEWQGALVLNADTLIPIEVQGTTQTDAGISLDWKEAVQGDSLRSVYEVLTELGIPFKMLHEYAVVIDPDFVLPVQFTGSEGLAKIIKPGFILRDGRSVKVSGMLSAFVLTAKKRSYQ